MNRNKQDLGQKIRVTLDLTPQFYERLEQLEDLVEADSKAGVIRQALQLYEYVARKSLEGWAFRAVNSNGKEENIVFLSVQPRLAP
jgi:uncharacterized protein (DUF608 family)